MSITPYLDDFGVDPETRRILDVALEKTRAYLGLADDFANGIIANRIVELAKAGERNPDLLCARAQSNNYAGICTGTDRGRAKRPRHDNPGGLYSYQSTW